MTELRKRMIECLQLRGLSERTQESYVRAVRQLSEHYHKSPDLITEEELLASCIPSNLSAHVPLDLLICQPGYLSWFVVLCGSFAPAYSSALWNHCVGGAISFNLCGAK